jgi:hypothetical protein
VFRASSILPTAAQERVRAGVKPFVKPLIPTSRTPTPHDLSQVQIPHYELDALGLCRRLQASSSIYRWGGGPPNWGLHDTRHGYDTALAF